MGKMQKEKQTSLGINLIEKGPGHFCIDLSKLKSFTGLSVIARMIGNDIFEQSKTPNSDVVVRRNIIKEITPELADLSITRLFIYARSSVLQNLPLIRKEFQEQLISVFGTLQRPGWGGILFPEYFTGERHEDGNPPGLLFPFHIYFDKKDIDYYFLVERDLKGQFLRIVIESEQENRINLSAIPHTVVDDLNRRTYLQGLTRFTESLYYGIMREIENFKSDYTEFDRKHHGFFEQLRNAGLSDVNSLTVRWSVEQTDAMFRTEGIHPFLRKIFLVLEDRDVVNTIQDGSLIEVLTEGRVAYLDISRLGRCLNFSLGERRASRDIDYYLRRMPRLQEISLRHTDTLSKYRIFLIHHITSEILGTIRALDAMGCGFLHVLFVKYAGIVPGDYLEALLALNANRFRFNGLQKIESEHSIEGYYLLSNQYSTTDGLSELEALLETRKAPYFDAMQTAAFHLFFQEAREAKWNNQKILLIEDGGYLAPELNRLCLEGFTLGGALETSGIDAAGFRPNEELEAPLADWLESVLPGTIEHTRNGYDRLETVQSQFSTLAFPAASIAISDLKCKLESREVSVSILHAIESIFHGMGYVLSGRQALVLGSSGAIGKNLMQHLAVRLLPDRLAGIDIALASPVASPLEVKSLEELPESFLLDTDLFIGVIGKSILEQKLLERLILKSNRKTLFFASGSTKTVEFTHLSRWIGTLETMENPTIDGVEVRIESEPIRDPQTSMIQGTVVRFTGDRFTRQLCLLGNLTPINFLYYGVPTETMDDVLGLLLSLTAGVVARSGNGSPLPKRLLAVDRQIDADGNDL